MLKEDTMRLKDNLICDNTWSMPYIAVKYFLFILLFISCENKEAILQEEVLKDNKIIFGEFVNSGISGKYILNLPYEIEDDVEFIFYDDTPLAIDIIEIYVDGEELLFSDNVEIFRHSNMQTSLNILPIIKDKKEYIIQMQWYLYSNRLLCWYNGKGASSEKLNIFGFEVIYPITNAYTISNDKKQMVIRYRILFPYSTMTIDDLRNKTYKDNFSKEKIMIVDTGNIFNQKEFY